MYSQLLQEDSTDIKEPPAGLPTTFVSGKAYDLVGTIPSETTNDATAFHQSLLAKFRLDINGGRIDSGGVLESLVEVRYSWSPVVDAPSAHGDHYALVFLNVNISVQFAGADEWPRDDPSVGLKELLNTVQSLGPLAPGASWSGRALLVLPARAGYLAHTECFQQRFKGCTDLGVLRDRTVAGQHLHPVQSRELHAVLDGCVLMLVRPDSHDHLSSEATLLEEVHARINFQWLLVTE
ncbi:MAG: hypothetical protein LQ349_008913 [Xanthoria aureola]|nr:MAG: hypothetical protein LQ349_008913 [Xanthoria aureola]